MEDRLYAAPDMVRRVVVIRSAALEFLVKTESVIALDEVWRYLVVFVDPAKTVSQSLRTDMWDSPLEAV